jgi:hypothetical protein
MIAVAIMVMAPADRAFMGRTMVAAQTSTADSPVRSTAARRVASAAHTLAVLPASAAAAMAVAGINN